MTSPSGAKWGLRTLAFGYLGLLLLAPVGMIFFKTFEHGIGPPIEAMTSPDALHAIWLTLLMVAVAVPLNTLFGVGCALLLVRHKWKGNAILDGIINLPFAISPIVVGLALFLLYGNSGWFGPTLSEWGIQVLFSTPGMILASVFVSLPFVVRETVPVLQEIGTEQEQAASTLGANAWQTFWRITLPAIRWGVAYGVVLTTARVLGEFGAVTIVSGSISGETETLPLFVAKAFEQFNEEAAYAGAIVLALLALTTLLLMSVGGRKAKGGSKAQITIVPRLRLFDKRQQGGFLMGITVEGARKRFGDFQALDDVSINVPDGSLTALLGPSGSGKSTLLRAIAGLEELDGGQVVINGTDATSTPAQKREVGFVFQHYAAFKHMTVFGNVGFGLKIRKWDKAKINDRVHELLRLVQLDGLAERYPDQLSGGQRQRMALARALAVEPQVLLLDEPFGALDAKVRKDLRVWLRRLHDEMHVTTIFVTHDQEEAMDVAEQLVVMNEGRVEQSGTADDLYENPANEFVMSFVGEVNRLGEDFVRPHDMDVVLEARRAHRGGDGPADRRPRLRDPGRVRARRRNRGLGAADPPRAPEAGAARGPDRLPAARADQKLQR